MKTKNNSKNAAYEACKSALDSGADEIEYKLKGFTETYRTTLMKQLDEDESEYGIEEFLGVVVVENSGKNMKTDRFVITVIGVDTVGIVAGVTRVMSDFGVNIIDIRQTLMEDIFTMLMIGEVKSDSFVLKDFQDKMAETGQERKVEIRVQHEDVFRYMHRI